MHRYLRGIFSTVYDFSAPMLNQRIGNLLPHFFIDVWRLPPGLENSGVFSNYFVKRITINIEEGAVGLDDSCFRIGDADTDLGCHKMAVKFCQAFKGVKTGAYFPVICGAAIVEGHNEHLDRNPFERKQDIVVTITDRTAQQFIESFPALLCKNIDKTLPYKKVMKSFTTAGDKPIP